jgi:hypothetical protein
MQTCYEQYLDHVKSGLKSEAYLNAPDIPYDPADHPAVCELDILANTAKNGEFYARKISAPLAKAWANGEHKPVFRQLSGAPDDKYPVWEEFQNEVKATGGSIQRGLDDFERCFYALRYLPARLDSSFGEAEAQKFSEGYAPVCSLYDSAIKWMLT